MPRTPTDRLLTAMLLVAPLAYLVADTTYALRGWDDPTAGVVHVLAAIGYGFVVLRVAGWLPDASRLRALLVLTGLVGLAGDVAYGLDTIHVALGDTPLVDQPGAANLVKPLGFFFPLSLVLVAVGLARLGQRWQAVTVLAAALAFPVAHVADLGPLAVVVAAALAVALGSLVSSAVAVGGGARGSELVDEPVGERSTHPAR